MLTFRSFKADVRTEPLPQVPPDDAPPVAPCETAVRHVQCDGEPPLEAIGNSGIC
jgi:hypothetical protein